MRQGYRQTGNLATITTSLSGDALLVTELQANEGLSEPFSVRLQLKIGRAHV